MADTFIIRVSARLDQVVKNCVKTVSEPYPFEALGFRFDRKQIPQIVVNVRHTRKTMEPLETTRLPWAHLRTRVNPSEIFRSRF